MLAVVPLTGLLLAGCGGSDNGTDNGEGTGAQTVTPTAPAAEETVPTSKSQRYDITSVMVCETVQTTMDGLNPKAKPQQVQSALRKALNSAFKGSTTPKATLADINVDRMLLSGCPNVAAPALRRMRSEDVYDFATLAAAK